MARREIKVIFAGDASALERTLTTTKGKLKEFGGGFKDTALGVLGGLSAANAAGAAFDFLGSSIKDAADEQSNIKVLANTLKNAGIPKSVRSSVEDWITSTQNATGVLDDELRPALGKLVSSGVPLAQAQTLLAQGLDIAASRGKPLGTVVEALAKGYNGQTGALGRLGLKTKDTEGKAKSFAAIMDDAKTKMGGAAQAAADTASGKMKILQARFADLKEDLGNKLIPVLNAVVSWVLDSLLPALERFAGWVSDHWPKIRDTIVKVTQQMWRYLEPTWNTIVAFIKAAIKIVQGVINVVMGLIHGDWSRAWEGIKGILGGVWDGIKNYVTNALTAVWRIIQTIGGWISGAWSAIWDGFSGIVSGIWSGVVSVIRGFVNTIIDAINWFIRGLNHIHFTIPDWLPSWLGGGKSFGIHISEISHWGGGGVSSGGGGAAKFNLADGGVVRARPGGTVVNLAEAGLDEAVLRVRKGTIVGRAPAGDGLTIVVQNNGTFIGDEQKFARHLADLVVRQKRTGGPLAAALGA